jgi:hypothetical protein
MQVFLQAYLTSMFTKVDSVSTIVDADAKSATFSVSNETPPPQQTTKAARFLSTRPSLFQQ